MFVESRQIKTVDKKPPKVQALQGPAILTGAFSNALTAVSLEFKNCYDYTLTSGRKLHRRPVLIVDYALKEEAAKHDKNCPGPELNHGRAYINAQTMQVVRLEQTTPHCEIAAGIYGDWTWTIDYDTDAEWYFTATYRDYHELTVTSRILPGVNYNPKQ
ncbi:MAG: hypothetical protein ABT04_03695 [Granulicella sp. SCN 62-9]|nr:MAG: hypothetical protein ABT04_03695 [Granulicella sp. SCN 62-9]